MFYLWSDDLVKTGVEESLSQVAFSKSLRYAFMPIHILSLIATFIPTSGLCIGIINIFSKDGSTDGCEGYYTVLSNAQVGTTRIRLMGFGRLQD